MRTELDYHTFEQPIVRNNDGLGFKILKNKVNDTSRRHIPKGRANINNPSWINNDIKQAIGRRQRAYEQKERSTKKELSQDSFCISLRELKELLNRKNAIKN